jgi:hypothetical protein
MLSSFSLGLAVVGETSLLSIALFRRDRRRRRQRDLLNAALRAGMDNDKISSFSLSLVPNLEPR